VAFKEIVLLLGALGGREEILMVAVLYFTNEEIAGVYLSVNSNLRVRHIKIILNISNVNSSAHHTT